MNPGEIRPQGELEDGGNVDDEIRTDELERPVIQALGQDLDELLDYLDPWSEAIIDAGSYPPLVAGVYSLGGGPHMGSGLMIDNAAGQFDR